MNRRNFVKTAVILPVSMHAVLTVSAQTPEPVLASEDDAKKAVKTLDTFLKLVAAGNPEDQQSAWNMLTAGFQQYYFPGGVSSLTFEPFKVYGISDDVTIEASKVSAGQMDFVVQANISGFINPHGLYTLNFHLTPDFLIDDYITNQKISVPDGMKAIKVRAVISEGDIRVNHASFELKGKDVAIVNIRNDGANTHFVQVFRLNDGVISVDFASMLVTGQPVNELGEAYGIAQVSGLSNAPMEPVTELGLLDPDAGTYVMVITTNPSDSLLGKFAEFTINK